MPSPSELQPMGSWFHQIYYSSHYFRKNTHTHTVAHIWSHFFISSFSLKQRYYQVFFFFLFLLHPCCPFVFPALGFELAFSTRSCGMVWLDICLQYWYVYNWCASINKLDTCETFFAYRIGGTWIIKSPSEKKKGEKNAVWSIWKDSSVEARRVAKI